MNDQSNRKPIPQPFEPYPSSPWVFNEDAFTLDLHEVTSSGVKRWLYSVDLEECATPAQVLDWIMHIHGKLWATDEVLAGLVRALFRCLGPAICFTGATRGPTDVRAIILKRMKLAHARPTVQSTQHGIKRPTNR